MIRLSTSTTLAKAAWRRLFRVRQDEKHSPLRMDRIIYVLIAGPAIYFGLFMAASFFVSFATTWVMLEIQSFILVDIMSVAHIVSMSITAIIAAVIARPVFMAGWPMTREDKVRRRAIDNAPLPIFGNIGNVSMNADGDAFDFVDASDVLDSLEMSLPQDCGDRAVWVSGDTGLGRVSRAETPTPAACR